VPYAEHPGESIVIARLLALALLLAATMLVATLSASAQVWPVAAPAAQPSPTSVAKPAAKPAGTPESDPFAGMNWSAILGGVGIILAGLSFYAWYRSNQAEARPNAEQREDIRRFVEDDFARYVAHGLVASGDAEAATAAEDEGARSRPAGGVNVAADEGWRKVFLQQLDVHHELHRFDKGIALSIYRERIDAAVSRVLAAREENTP
jgi:hypothetical protein